MNTAIAYQPAHFPGNKARHIGPKDGYLVWKTAYNCWIFEVIGDNSAFDIAPEECEIGGDPLIELYPNN